MTLSRHTRLVARTPLKTRTELKSSGPLERSVPVLSEHTPRTESAPARRTRATSGRAESFPRAVAALLAARDLWCVHCGSPYNLQNHHRRIRGIGGDSRDHTDCACNGVRLCILCHVPWAHTEGRREAEAEGIIIPRSETGPWRRPFMIHTEAGSGFMAWPTCDGRLLVVQPEGALAA